MAPRLPPTVRGAAPTTASSSTLGLGATYVDGWKRTRYMNVTLPTPTEQQADEPTLQEPTRLPPAEQRLSPPASPSARQSRVRRWVAGGSEMHRLLGDASEILASPRERRWEPTPVNSPRVDTGATQRDLWWLREIEAGGDPSLPLSARLAAQKMAAQSGVTPLGGGAGRSVQGMNLLTNQTTEHPLDMLGEGRNALYFG
jgi:hypothetical protein